VGQAIPFCTIPAAHGRCAPENVAKGFDRTLHVGALRSSLTLTLNP